MAKAKKGKLTIEDALVPIEEQPYEIPENWCWTYLKAGFDVTSSKRVHKSDWIDEGIPFYRTRELVKLSDNGEVDNELFISEELYDELVEEYGKPALNDILISGVGTIGVPYVVNSNDKFYFKDGNVIWLKNKELYDAKYIFYLYKSLFMINQIHDMSAGTTVDTYTIVNANSTKVPLPPLLEQKRIVEQIEKLFSKLDEAKEKAQEVVEQFELHKESILHQAFSGRLSKKWRNENGISDDSWKQTTLGLYLNPMKTRKPEGETFRYIDIDAIDNKRQVIRKAKETLVSEAPSRASRAVNSGDVLFSMVRPYLKNIAFVTEDMFDCIASTGFYVCNCKDGLYSKYLYELLRSKDAIDYLMQFMKGDNSPSIRKDDLLDMPLRLPSVDEQKIICQIVSSLLEKEEDAKEASAKVIEQIDLMKKSILAKAFRGELGTNIESEECSIELLKRIIE